MDDQQTQTTQTMSSEIKQLATALVEAQKLIKPAVKDATNPFFKKKYASLSSVWDAARGPLTANGLSVVQTMSGNSDEVCVVTTLMHTSGQWIRGGLSMAPVKKDPQGIGSCLTYARRYALAAIVGICPDDDDGNDASKKTTAKKERTVVDDANEFLGEEPGDDVPEGVIPDVISECTFGKREGVAWKDMPEKDLEWYAEFLHKAIEDPKKKRYKADNMALLRGVQEALENQ